MALRIPIDTGNAAFDDDYEREVIRLLSMVSDAVARGIRDGTLHDLNGNRVGSFGEGIRA